MPEPLTAPCPGSVTDDGAVAVKDLSPPLRPPVPVITEAVSYSSPDGVTISAFVSRPDDGKPHPAVVYVHGGLAEPALEDPGRVIASAGFVVMTPAYRGTALEGMSVGQALRVADIGHGDVLDVKAGAEWLLEQPYTDGTLGLVGTSLGGGLANELAFLYPDQWDAVASFFGVTDWACVMKLVSYGSQAAQVIATAFGGTPEEVPEEYLRYSPVYQAGSVRAPYYVAQGLDDELFPPGESEKWVRALREAGVDVTWRLYSGEEHGFIVRAPYDSPAWQDLFDWLHRQLGGPGG
jgi:dipeptidyl aminopeptidase/acylaminoacyl peptidase